MNLSELFKATITVAATASTAADDWLTGSTFVVDYASTAMAFIAVDDNTVAGAATTEGRHRRSSWSLSGCHGGRSPLTQASRRQKSLEAEKLQRKNSNTTHQTHKCP